MATEVIIDRFSCFCPNSGAAKYDQVLVQEGELRELSRLSLPLISQSRSSGPDSRRHRTPSSRPQLVRLHDIDTLPIVVRR